MSLAIILNGERIGVEINDEYIICADGGYNLLNGKKPDCIIGDFDSIENFPSDVTLIRHNPEKNHTDGELCVIYAIKQGYLDINIYGALGNRMDHFFGNLSLLKLANRMNARAVIRDKDCDIYYSKNNFDCKVSIGDTISILPFGEEAVVNAQGLKYPLEKLHLKNYHTRGISNIAEKENIHIEINSGEVLIFHNKTKT